MQIVKGKGKREKFKTDLTLALPLVKPINDTGSSGRVTLAAVA
jgi:hypothetical protein